MLIKRTADALVVRTPAKLNLFLGILKKRPDGYHELETLMVAVSLFDTLRFKEDTSRQIHLTCNADSLPTDRENLVWRAAELLQRRAGVRKGVRIRLTKRIPLAAGLAGGSSDAAATLVGLNQLWNLQLSIPQLAQLAAKLGSDVPFFLSATAAWCTGRGEKVKPTALPKRLHFVLACPAVEVSTAEVYRRVRVPRQPRASARFRQALRGGSVDDLGAELHNRLQPAAEGLCPDVRMLRKLFAKLQPIGHGMSGSGPSYFALCRSRLEAQRLADAVRRQQQRSRRMDLRRTRIHVVSSLVQG